MLRRTIMAFAICAAAAPACAEVWMVRSSGELGCGDRETLVSAFASQNASERSARPPAGCVELYAGERLLDQPEAGAGFNDYMRVQRGDGSTVFVRSSAVVPDPGIGSVTDDRPE